MASSLSVLDHPITMLPDYVATQPTTLRFKNHGKGGSTVTDITNGSSPKEVLTVDMKKAGTTASRRVYHDPSGKVLFELRRSWTSNDSFVGPPNDASRPYALIAPCSAPLKDKFDMYVQHNSSAGEERETKLEIRGQDVWKKNTFVYHGKDLVMQVRLVNLITCYVPFASNEWDVHAAQGMDTAAASVIVGYLAASLYDSPYFISDTKSEDRSSHGMSLASGITMGAAMGAGGGGGGA